MIVPTTLSGQQDKIGRVKALQYNRILRSDNILSKIWARPLFIILMIVLIGLCSLALFIVVGSGVTYWLMTDKVVDAPAAAALPTRRVVIVPTATSSPTSTSTATPPPSPTHTPTPTPSPTVTSSPTLVPPTATSSFTPAPSTPTPAPTDTPTPPPPSFPFTITETEGYETNHLDFDVYVAITDAKNKPLSGYRVIGSHSSGLQIESQVSAGDWTVNSGARQYKGGNVKFSAPNSPAGTWSLQLVDEANQPVAPAIQFPFDAASPTWNFILYRRLDN